MGKASTTLGMFVGVLKPEMGGRLLLRRRTELESITGKSFKGCWELPGGAVEETKEEVNYCYPIKEAFRELEEEVGIFIDNFSLMVPVFLTFFKGPKGYDLAGVVPVISCQRPTKGETIYVNPAELSELAKSFALPDKNTGQDGRGLLSGWGKRMCCMALAAMTYSPNSDFVEQARKMLNEIQKDW